VKVKNFPFHRFQRLSHFSVCSKLCDLLLEDGYHFFSGLKFGSCYNFALFSVLSDFFFCCFDVLTYFGPDVLSDCTVLTRLCSFVHALTDVDGQGAIAQRQRINT